MPPGCHFFSSIKINNPDLVEDDKIAGLDHTMEVFEKTFMACCDQNCSDRLNIFYQGWYERDLEAVFGIDVSEHAFNQGVGFSIIKGKQCDVLVMRLENLEECFAKALHIFLGWTQPIQIKTTNVGVNQWYGKEYAYALKHFRVPYSECVKIYSQALSRHFYLQGMIDQFIQRWSSP